MTARKILSVCYGGGHATMLLPVVRALRARGAARYELPVLGLTLARPLFEAQGIATLGFRDFIEATDETALAYGRELAAGMHAAHTGIDLDESVAYLGLSFADLVDEIGEPEARRRFATQGRQCLLPRRTLARIFDRLAPDALVTTNSPRAERAARLVARARGIPVFALSDLLGRSRLHPLEADHLFVACKQALENYRGADDVHVERFHLVGNPAMDAALDYRDKPDPAWMAERFPPWKAGARYVVSAEQESFMRRADDIFQPWTDAERRRNLDALYRAAQANDAVLLVRPHPSLDPEPYARWVAARPAGTAFMAASDPLHRLLSSSQLLVGNNSTVMLDALYLRCPVLLVEYPGSKNSLDFDRLGYAFSAELLDARKLRQAVRAALGDEDAQRRLQRHFESEFPPPPCAPRIVDIIERELG